MVTSIYIFSMVCFLVYTIFQLQITVIPCKVYLWLFSTADPTTTRISFIAAQLQGVSFSQSPHIPLGMKEFCLLHLQLWSRIIFWMAAATVVECPAVSLTHSGCLTFHCYEPGKAESRQDRHGVDVLIFETSETSYFFPPTLPPGCGLPCSFINFPFQITELPFKTIINFYLKKWCAPFNQSDIFTLIGFLKPYRRRHCS